MLMEEAILTLQILTTNSGSDFQKTVIPQRFENHLLSELHAKSIDRHQLGYTIRRIFTPWNPIFLKQASRC